MRVIIFKWNVAFDVSTRNSYDASPLVTNLVQTKFGLRKWMKSDSWICWLSRTAASFHSHSRWHQPLDRQDWYYPFSGCVASAFISCENLSNRSGSFKQGRQRKSRLYTAASSLSQRAYHWPPESLNLDPGGVRILIGIWIC